MYMSFYVLFSSASAHLKTEAACSLPANPKVTQSFGVSVLVQQYDINPMHEHNTLDIYGLQKNILLTQTQEIWNMCFQ